MLCPQRPQKLKKIQTFCPLNSDIRSVSSLSSCGVKRRHTRLSSINAASSRRRAASCCAIPASRSALDASALNSPSIWWLLSRSFVSTRDAMYVKSNSPATPNVTKIPPDIVRSLSQGKADIGHWTRSQKSLTSCQYSKTSPITTSNVAASSIAPQKSRDDSRLLETLSRAEGPIDRYEERKQLCLLISALGPALHMGDLFSSLLSPLGQRPLAVLLKYEHFW